jgi:uncharacterized protein (UPF0335 family)
MKNKINTLDKVAKNDKPSSQPLNKEELEKILRRLEVLEEKYKTFSEKLNKIVWE